MTFLQLFSSSKIKKEASGTDADKIIAFVENLINREDLVADLVKKYGEAQKLQGEKRELSYIPIYIGFEAFVTKNKPIIVKQEFTKEQLRETIRDQFAISALIPAFQLIFLVDGSQNALLYEQGAQKLATYIMNSLGLPHLQSAFANLKQQKKNFIHVTHLGLSFDSLNISLKQFSEKDVKELFEDIFKVLFGEIANSVGSNLAEKVISDIFDEIRTTYDYDLIAKFLDILPEGVLEGERIRRLGRDELESKIQSRTRELDEARKQLEQKLDLIKKQNAELSQAKQALTKSLQEEKTLEEALKKEKEQVEEKVKERTAELNNAMATLQVSYQQTEYEKARLLASVNNLSLGFVMTDSKDKIIAFNQISSRILRSQEKEFSDIQQLHDYLKNSINFLDYYQKCKNEKALQKIEDIKFGNSFLKLFFTPIMLNDNCIGVVILLEDISEAKLLERSKDEFFAVASHELRTPLTAVRGYTSLILDNFHDIIKADPTLVNMITNIHASSIRLIKIVNSFLDASKLEQGKVTFNLQNCILTPIIESVTDDLTPLAEEKKITLTFEKQDNIPYVYTDPERIKQILYNLVGNAVKFTEKGGITVSLENTGEYVKVRVKDTGLGVSEEYRQLLFRKFQQAGERILTRDAATGSGMGLYISKLLIEAMHGTINIESTKLGEGSIFAFTIPVAKKE